MEKKSLPASLFSTEIFLKDFRLQMKTFGIQTSWRNSKETGYQVPGSIVLLVIILFSCHMTKKYMDMVMENSLSFTDRISRISTLISTWTVPLGFGDSSFWQSRGRHQPSTHFSFPQKIQKIIISTFRKLQDTFNCVTVKSLVCWS